MKVVDANSATSSPLWFCGHRRCGPAAFNDVTHGVNDEGSKTHGGFAASTGWDPATGVGTPNFAAMLKAL